MSIVNIKKRFECVSCKICSVSGSTSGSKASTGKIVCPFQMQTKTLCAAEIASGYVPFISKGFVSLVDSRKNVPVKIFRDSGALNTFFRESVLYFSPRSDTGSCAPIRGMGLTTIFVLVHTVNLSCSLVQGSVVVGVHPELPVDIILGNDLAGRCMWPDAATQDVTSHVLNASSPVKPQVSEIPEQPVSLNICSLTVLVHYLLLGQVVSIY